MNDDLPPPPQGLTQTAPEATEHKWYDPRGWNRLVQVLAALFVVFILFSMGADENPEQTATDDPTEESAQSRPKSQAQSQQFRQRRRVRSSFRRFMIERPR